VFAVLRNGRYQILKDNLVNLKGRSAETGTFVGIDLDQPTIDYVALARSMGVAATRVETEDAVSGAAREAMASGRPMLLEVAVASR
jgi:benzoylformate decarboxylase